jgi:hypothetical protein
VAGEGDEMGSSRVPTVCAAAARSAYLLPSAVTPLSTLNPRSNLPLTVPHGFLLQMQGG